MSLSITSTNPPYYQDSGEPAISYQSIGVNVQKGQSYFDNSTSDFYICTDNSNQNALVWINIPKIDQIIAQLQSDWDQTNILLASYIANKPNVRSQSSVARSLNIIFQISKSILNYF